MSDQTRWGVAPGFGVIWITVAVDLIGFGIVLPILPLYAEEFGASPAVIGLLVASFSVAQLVFAPITGWLSDRFGRRPVLIASLFGSAIGSLVTGLAGSLWVLFAGRLIDGVSGSSVSVAQAAVTDVARPEDRPRLLGLLGAAFGVGFVLGPALGALAALGGSKVPFFVAAGIALINGVVAIWRLPETRDRRASATEPVVPAAPGSRETLARLVGVSFIAMVAFSGFEATFALLGERRVDLGISSAGVVFAAIGVVLVLVQVTAVGPANAHLGEAGAIRLGLLVEAAGLGLVAAAMGWLLLAPALAILAAGQGLLSPTLASAVAGRAPPARRGATLGVQQSAGGLARVLGPIAGGLLFEHVGVGAPTAVGAVLVLAALALVPRSVSRTAPEASPTA